MSLPQENLVSNQCFFLKGCNYLVSLCKTSMGKHSRQVSKSRLHHGSEVDLLICIIGR